MIIEYPTWRLSLPEHMSELPDEDEEAPICLASDRFDGVLQISSYLAPEAVLISDLEEFAFGDGDTSVGRPVVFGDFDGIAFTEVDDESVIHMFYLKHRATMLFVTYTFEHEINAASEDDLRQVLEGLEGRVGLN